MKYSDVKVYRLMPLMLIIVSFSGCTHIWNITETPALQMGRQFRVGRAHEGPRPLAIDRRDEIADPPLEVHGVAAQAVVGELLLPVLLGVEEDRRVGRAVRAASPVCELTPMAGGAAADHRRDVLLAQADLDRKSTRLNS